MAFPINQANDDSEANFRLSQREVEILKLTAEGRTSGEIGKILNIAVDTVNFHIRKAVRRLGVTNKTSAAVKAVRLGLI